MTHCTRCTPEGDTHTTFIVYVLHQLPRTVCKTRRQMNVNVSFSHVRSIRHFIMLNGTFFHRIHRPWYQPSEHHLFSIRFTHFILFSIFFSAQTICFHMMWTWVSLKKVYKEKKIYKEKKMYKAKKNKIDAR